MRRVFVVFLIPVLVFSALSMSCNKTKDTTGGPIKISVWAWDPNFNIAIMNEAKSRYLANNPDIEIEVIDMAKTDVEQKLLTNLASGITKTLPDIVLIEDYNAQKYLTAYSSSFVDLTSQFNYDDFVDYKVQLGSLDGKHYSVPFDAGTTGLFYRSDYLAQAGYSEEDLQNITWDEFIDIGKNVEKKTGKKFLSIDITAGDFLRIIMQSSGVWYDTYRDADGNLDLSKNKVLAQALEVYKKLFESKIYIDAPSWAQYVAPITAGDVASVTTGVWIMGTVKSAREQSGKWKVAPTPRLDIPESVNASNLGGSSWYVLNKGNERVKQQTIDFLKSTFGSDVDFYQKILVDNGAVGSYIPAAKGDAYNIEDPFFQGQKVFQDFINWANKIKFVDYGTNTYEIDNVLLSMIGDIIKGSISIEDGLNKATQVASSNIQQ